MISIQQIFNGLVEQIDILNNHYENGTPLVSDDVFNSLLYNALEMQKEHPELYVPSNVINNIRKTVINTPVKHLSKMLSLDNVFTERELELFLLKCNAFTGQYNSYIVEDKMDGVAIALLYVHGKILNGSLRGDGVVGDDIGINLNYIRDIPAIINDATLPDFFEIRGEVIMSKESFDILNQKGSQYANTRNAVSGLLRSKLIDKSLINLLQFKAYGCAGFSKPDSLQYLSTLGFKISEKIFISDNVNEVVEYCIKENETRHTRSYDIDGLVIKIRDEQLRENLSATNKYPKWAVAYKFPAQEALGIIGDIRHSVGRTGVITPVAYFTNPIPLGGVMVSNANLHNYDQIQKLNVAIGDTVRVIRAGDVIPEIVEVFIRPTNRVPVYSPLMCPVCKQGVSVFKTFTLCHNTECDARILRQLAHFVSIDGLDIKGLGSETLKLLVESGVVNTRSDILSLTFDKIKGCGIGDKTADNIIASIDKAKYTTLAKFIISLGIPNVGAYCAQLFSDHYKTWEVFRQHCLSKIKLKDIGPVTLEALSRYFEDPVLSSDADKMASILTFKPVLNDDTKSDRKVLVVTGEFHNMVRYEVTKLLNENNFIVNPNVTKKTSYLIVGNNPSGGKLQSAKEYSIPIIQMGDVFDISKLESL